MCPVLLHLLLLATPSSVFTSASPEDSTSLNFIVAFPENIAYFHPDHPTNKIRIMALYPQTQVYIKRYERDPTTMTLNAGETREFAPEGLLELSRAEISNKSLQISSNKAIIVHVVHLKKHSIQTALVTPSDKLGTEYLIPPVPMINGTTHPAEEVTTKITERGPFKLIIINTEQHNLVTVTGVKSKVINLQPYHVTHIWLKEEEAWRAVSTKLPVAVLFGHTCAHQNDCTCGQLYTMLPPIKEEEQKFYIPPFLTKDAEGKTFVLVSNKDSSEIKSFSQNSLLLETPGSAIFYRPGLLLALIPETDFSACSVVTSVPDAANFAVIVVHKNLTAGVHFGSQSLESFEWQLLDGKDYVSTHVELASDKNVIWHTSSKMAVYFVGIKGGRIFGNPAAVISKSPDFRGCLLVPEVVKIGEVAGGWQESLKYCENQDLDLVSLPKSQLQRHIYNKIVQADDGPKNMWIGMRRSSQSGQWYWLSKEPVTDTNWAKGKPGTVHEGQCAMMTLKSQDFSWRDEDCCEDAHPVCYKSPIFLPV